MKKPSQEYRSAAPPASVHRLPWLRWNKQGLGHFQRG